MELTLNTTLSSYKIIIKKGVLNNLKDYLDDNSKVMIISDDGVPFSYVGKVKSQFSNAYSHIIPQGEKSKSIENFVNIQKDLLEHNFTRNDILIALGGGVVGDLTGFVASTFKRGIKYIQIPTTTLSQIDSSVGGKTAIDLDDYKNVVGSFYQPSLVLIDVDTLKTLPTRHFYNGLIEALKIGLTYDESLVSLFEEDNFEDNVEQIIEKAVYLKKLVVEKDEKELNERKVLNFGHTIGHAIESINLGKMLHGECVAKGMLYFIENNELKEKVKNILGKMQILSNYNIDTDLLMKYIKNDKKANSNSVSIISVDKIGTYKIIDLSYEEVLKKVEMEG